MSESAQLVYVALGGAGEIGMNCYLYGYGPEKSRKWLMVDCGIGFGDEATTPGIELVMPDFSFAENLGDALVGIVITHAHEDHVGAVARVRDRIKAPIYATRFTAEIARRKLVDEGRSPKAVQQVDPGQRIDIGPFNVELLPITHSIPEPNAVAIRTKAGLVVHSGDFKLDPDPIIGAAPDMALYEALGDEGVLAFACDSTNVLAPGSTKSEGGLRTPIMETIRACEGAVAATTFASNVGRVITLAEAAIACGRTVVVAGRAMKRMIEVALETRVVDSFPAYVTEDKASDIPPENAFYIVTGSQGEHRAAMARIANGSHPSITLEEGDTVLFSSKMIPGNETQVIKIYNKLSEKGVHVIDADMAEIHASGHARRDELERMHKALKPKIALPLHGEHRHLVEHARYARDWGAKAAPVAPNGQVVRLSGRSPGISDEVETGRVYLDGSIQIGAFDGVIRDRLRMARQGHCIVSLIVDEAGEQIADPDARIVGGPVSAHLPLEELVIEAVDSALERASPRQKTSDDAIEEIAVRAARKVCADRWGKKPVVTVMIARLED